MYFVDFMRTVNKFNIDKSLIVVTELKSDVWRDPYKVYSFVYGGLKFNYLDDGKNNDVIVSGDINSFEYIGSNNMYGIKVGNNGLCRISTREGFLFALIAASREDKEKGIGTYEQINASIIGDILAEVDPFVSNLNVLSNYGAGYIRFDDANIRGALKHFDEAVNPYSNMFPSAVDATKYPINLSINGSKDNRGTRLTIMDLKTKSSTQYILGPDGFSYRLNSIVPSENRRLEIIHDYSEKYGIERIIIRGWDKKNKVLDVIYDVANKKFGRLIDNKAHYNYTDATEGEIEFIISALMDEGIDYALDVTASINNKTSRARI